MCSSFQRLSQKKSRAMQLRLASANGDSKNSGNLFVLIAFYVVQNENPSRSSRQLSNRLLQIHSLGEHRRTGYFIPAFFVRALFIHPRRVLSIRLPRVQHHVHGESVQPRRERAFSPELRKLFPRADEYILRQLLTLAATPRHPRAQRVHSVGVRAVQALERLPIAAGRERYVL